MAQDKSNGAAMGFAVSALAVLGEAERARDWIRRALLIDPDNKIMRYNFACALSIHLRDIEGALELLAPNFPAGDPKRDLQPCQSRPGHGPAAR